MEDIEIPLPSNTGSWPPNPRTQRIKMWANIISTAVALIIAVAAVIKPADGGQNEAVYKQMTIQLNVLREENVQQHDDIMALRKYLDDYLRSSTVVGPNEHGVTKPNNANAPVILIPIDSTKIRISPGPNSQPILVLPAGTPPPLPDLHAGPSPLSIPDFQVIVDQAAAAEAAKKASAK